MHTFTQKHEPTHIARHIWDNAFDKSKPLDERLPWIKIHQRVYTHAYVHIDRYRKAALKMEEEIRKMIKNLPTRDKPLAVLQSDLDDYMIKLCNYLAARIEFEFWKTTCDWEKEDYPRLLKGIPSVGGSLAVNCQPQPILLPIPLSPTPIIGKIRSKIK